jgi:hypothetical protein
MAAKITPTCRYNHGNLVLQKSDQPKTGNAYSVDSFPPRHVAGQGQEVYSFVIYKCPVCSYLEFHDE